MVEQEIDHPILPASEPGLKSAALNLFQAAYWTKRSLYIPRFDGFRRDGSKSRQSADPAWRPDTWLQESYALNAKYPEI